MWGKIVSFLLSKPKTYIPLVAIVLLQLASNVGFEVTPELKHSVEVVLFSFAGWFMRQNMLKEKSLADVREELRREIKEELQKSK